MSVIYCLSICFEKNIYLSNTHHSFGKINIMENTPSAVTVQTMREFVENTVGFGEPVDQTIFSSLFGGTPNALYYGTRTNQTVASVNAMTGIEWDKRHLIDTDPIYQYKGVKQSFTDITSFVKKHMAQRGYNVEEMIRPESAHKLQQINWLLLNFIANYIEHVNPEVDVRTSYTLRPNKENMNYDLLFRFGMFSNDETMYLEFNYPELITASSYLITEDQVEYSYDSVKAFFEGFGAKAAFFKELHGKELSRLIVQNVIRDRSVLPEVIYEHYRSIVRSVKDHWHHTDKAVVDRLLPWGELQQVYRMIFTNGVDLAKIHVVSSINFNMIEAGEE